MNPIRGVALMATSPLALFTLFVATIMLMFGVAFSIYGPIFNAYQEGCIATQVP